MSKTRTVKVRFLGPERSRVIPRPEAADVEFPVGEPVEVPEKLGRQLATQGGFELVVARRRSDGNNVA